MDKRPRLRHGLPRRGRLALCLLAYPRAQRDRDGDYLLDLAAELAETRGTGRQAVSLVLGGLTARVRSLRRVRLVAGLVLAAILMTAGGGVAAALAGAAEVEVYACSEGECPALVGLVADRERDGWHCVRQERPGEVAWRCRR